jgi:hypothetical protein
MVPEMVQRLTGYPAILRIRYPAIKSGIRQDIGSLKKPDYPAGYPASRISGASLVFRTV